MRPATKSTPTTRDAALLASWRACGEPCDFRHWVQSFASWDVEPVVIAGAVVGAVFGKGPEIHVGVLPEHRRRWCTPRLWRWAVTNRQREFGYVFTRGKADNEFILRAGFKPMREVNGTTWFVRC
jgi:GNAT superfamily N-acetyltransferase